MAGGSDNLRGHLRGRCICPAERRLESADAYLLYAQSRRQLADGESALGRSVVVFRNSVAPLCPYGCQSSHRLALRICFWGGSLLDVNRNRWKAQDASACEHLSAVVSGGDRESYECEPEV